MPPRPDKPIARIVNAQFLLSLPKWSAKKVEPLPEICISGRSNVGKSSLINALVGQTGLARTSSTPGRTQELVVFSALARMGAHDVPFNLVDLPGYGYAKVPVALKAAWLPMMESYFDGNKRLRCCVFLVDIRRTPGSEDFELLERMAELEIPVIPVVTKVDKVSKTRRVAELRRIAESLELEDWHDLRPVSVHERTGLGELAEDIFHQLADDPLST